MSAQVLLSLPEVIQRVRYQRASIYAMCRPPTGKPKLFPSPVKLGNGERGAVAWIESDINAWVAAKIRGATADELCALVTSLEAQRHSAI